MVSLSNAQMRDFKARAPRLKAKLKVGKDGLSPQFILALDEALKHHELVKVKFEAFKEKKKEFAPQLAERSGSHLVQRGGALPAKTHRGEARHPMTKAKLLKQIVASLNGSLVVLQKAAQAAHAEATHESYNDAGELAKI